MLKDGDRYIELTYSVYPDDGGYVSRCVELGTTSQGETLDEAFENLREAVLLHLDTLEELGETPRYFKKRNIRIRNYRKPKTAPRPIDVPILPSEIRSRDRVPLGC